MYFSKLTCYFLLICFKVHRSKISAESDIDKFLLNYSKLCVAHVLCRQCISKDNTWYLHMFVTSHGA